MTKEFIQQTAKDYDMEIYQVEEISKKFPNEFYEQLEKYISQRASE